MAVGGLSPAAAQQRLTDQLAPRIDAPHPVTAGTTTTTLVPADAGLGVDYAASVRAVGGGSSWSPRHIALVLLGGSAATAAVATVDQPRLDAAVQGVATRVDRRPSDAGLALRDGSYRVTKGRTGLELQQPAAAAALVDGWLGEAPVALPVAATDPAVTTAEAEQVRTAVAQPALSGPVRVRAGDAGRFSVTPAMIRTALTFPAKDGTLAASLDADALRKAAEPALRTVVSSRPRDARVRLVGGEPKVVPAVDGTEVSASALAAAVEPVLTKDGSERTATVELTGAKAAFSTADAKALGITEVTGEFTTYFPYAEYRNVNIGRAAELINGTVVRPGKTFSLNKVVGERTRANGFTEGFIISGGKFKRELGGGVSQSATTTYNAMFFAGLTDIEHEPHTLYIDRYPPGREATVAWPNLDMEFGNDTRYGVLVAAEVTRATPSRRGSITVTMWSTKTWDKVTSTTPQKSNFTTGRDLVDDSASCEPQVPAQGFDVSYARLFYRDGQVAKRQNFSWRYGPTDRIRCD
ncbi:VanW family protein [uncultured Friedmanniella sp.]|uniref:VanW family protein n=1 Tax=uncultured Friedmanniella sp. TaxID=335381 RepID=UPI0035C9D4B1